MFYKSLKTHICPYGILLYGESTASKTFQNGPSKPLLYLTTVLQTDPGTNILAGTERYNHFLPEIGGSEGVMAALALRVI